MEPSKSDDQPEANPIDDIPIVDGGLIDPRTIHPGPKDLFPEVTDMPPPELPLGRRLDEEEDQGSPDARAKVS